jgi:DNA-binding NtrC family response regulator
MSGADLDVYRGMKKISCMVEHDFAPGPREATARDARILSAAAEKSPVHVLVVDDEPLIRWSVTASLADVGCTVQQASDAASALRAITTTAWPFDAVVLDLRLPDMDDLSLLGTIRQLIPAATVVLMTAFGTPEIVAEATALGAHAIGKPFELDALRGLVCGSEWEAN